jgi:hypothetical protein
MLVVRNDGTHDFINPNKVAAIAEASKDFEQRTQRLLYMSLDQSCPDVIFDGHVAAFAKWLTTRRADFRKLTVQDPQGPKVGQSH